MIDSCIYVSIKVSFSLFVNPVTVNQKNTTHKKFRVVKISNSCQQTFQNNFERCISASQSFKLTRLLLHIRVSKNFHTSEVLAGSSLTSSPSNKQTTQKAEN